MWVTRPHWLELQGGSRGITHENRNTVGARKDLVLLGVVSFEHFLK